MLTCALSLLITATPPVVLHFHWKASWTGAADPSKHYDVDIESTATLSGEDYERLVGTPYRYTFSFPLVGPSAKAKIRGPVVLGADDGRKESFVQIVATALDGHPEITEKDHADEENFGGCRYPADDGRSWEAVPHDLLLTWDEARALATYKKTWSGTLACGGPTTYSVWAEGKSPSVELEVDIPLFDSWLPEAGPDEATPGSSLRLIATLVDKKDKRKVPVVKAVSFELLDVSREPGTCINFPPDAKGTDDFSFRTSIANQDLDVAPDGRSARTKDKNGPFRNVEATLSSYDWAGHVRVRVTAIVAGTNERVVGHLKGDPGQEEIRIPKRRDRELTPSSWLDAHARGQADAADLDSQPTGDGHRGDGLSVYEEFRGVYVRGKHLRLDPNKKDLFVHVFTKTSPEKENLARGVGLFKTITGLEVHRVDAPELSGGHVINFNYGKSSHVVDQHGVYLAAAVGPEDYAQARRLDKRDMLGTPKDFAIVFVPSTSLYSATSRASYQAAGRYNASTVAHELAHTCNVYHHGDGDYSAAWGLVVDASGLETIVEGELRNGKVYGVPVVAKKEDGTVVSPRYFRTPRAVEVGVKQGQSSGDEDCVMRYDTAEAYVSTLEGGLRYQPEDHPPAGQKLCTTKDGHSINKVPRSPESRFGPAARGNCAAQLCVNDAAGH